MALLQYLPQGSCILTDELWALQCKSCQNYLLLGEFQAYVRKRKERISGRDHLFIHSLSEILSITSYEPHTVQGSREKVLITGT